MSHDFLISESIIPDTAPEPSEIGHTQGILPGLFIRHSYVTPGHVTVSRSLATGTSAQLLTIRRWQRGLLPHQLNENLRYPYIHLFFCSNLLLWRKVKEPFWKLIWTVNISRKVRRLLSTKLRLISGRWAASGSR